MNEINKQLKQKFKTHSKRGLTQADLAVRILRVNITTAGNWLNGRHTITGTNNVAIVLGYIAGEFDTKADEIIAEKGGSK